MPPQILMTRAEIWCDGTRTEFGDEFIRRFPTFGRGYDNRASGAHQMTAGCGRFVSSTYNSRPHRWPVFRCIFYVGIMRLLERCGYGVKAPQTDLCLQRCTIGITLSIVLEKIRLFLVVVEEGSLRRAADRLRISQSAVTRQMQSLELDLGGRILERTSAGVRLTSGGQALVERAKTLLADYDSTVAEVRRLNRGESERLRIGYIASAVQEYLGPALAELRRAYPRLKVKMLDQTPGETIIALRQRKIDLALTSLGVDLLSRDFDTHKLATVRSLVALPVSHRFATERQVSLSQLKGETFVRGPDDEVPGYTQRIIRFCRKYGGFRPRLATIDKFDSLVESLSLAANEEAISIQPAFISHLNVPNVVMVPIADAGATWDLFVVWQRGEIASPLRTLLSELNLKSQ
jgi:DNA-binding transcriptional LysR family regulator